MKNLRKREKNNAIEFKGFCNTNVHYSVIMTKYIHLKVFFMGGKGSSPVSPVFSALASRRRETGGGARRTRSRRKRMKAFENISDFKTVFFFFLSVSWFVVFARR